MKTLTLNKAGRIEGQEPVPSLTITIDEPVPELDGGRGWERHARFYFEEQADALVSALCESLPGGTLDRVLAKLLERKASLFRVPAWASDKPEVDDVELC